MSLAAAYLIVGDDPYLGEESLSQIVAEESDLSIDEFSGDADMSEILHALATTSMFGQNRIVVLRVDEISAPRAIELIKYLENPNPTSVLVILTRKSTPPLIAAVKKVGRLLDAGKGRRGDLMAWLREESKKRGVKLGGESMAALVEAVGDERLALAQALEELSLSYGASRVSPDDVRRQFRERSDTRVFGFVDAVATRDVGSALEALHILLRQGESPQSVFWTLTRHFRLLLTAADMSATAVAGRMGIPGWRAEKLVRQAKGFGRQDLARAYLALVEADRKMKRSEEPEELTLERAVVSIGTTAEADSVAGV